MTPDDLDALADAAEAPPGREWGLVGKHARLIALAPTLARDLAALQRWAEDIAHASRRRDQALHIYWDYFCDGGVKTPKRWRGESADEDWWHRYERYQARVAALLAEYAEMKETT